jgi:dienelactone hydrolase
MKGRVVRASLIVLSAVSAAILWAVPQCPAAPPPLEEFLKKEAFKLLDRRKEQVAAIKTPEQVAVRQKQLRSFFLASLGDLPERTPLNPRVVGQQQRDGYRIEKVIFESRPNHHVTAVLYLPDASPPYPGVLVPCGHSANGKAYESYQRMCILLARNGMAALCYDPIGQGERVQKLDAEGKPAVREGSTTEHTMAGVGALLVGRQAASYRIWDGFRALDYLASRPEIDPQRLGCTGNSGGGTETAYLMALDDRIAAAAPSCYITSLGRLFATIGPQDAEQNITGQVAAGFDHADYATLRAPRPTLLCVGTRDFFDIQGSWDTFREVKLMYGRLGFGERVDLFESDEPHGLTKPRRTACARWLSRWLLRRDEPITEPELPTASDADLQCTRTGQVLSDLPGISVFELNSRRADELRPSREEFARKSSSSQFRAKVQELLGITGRKPTAVPVRTSRTGKTDHGWVEHRTLESEPGIEISAVERGPGDERSPVLVLLGDDSGEAVRLAAQGRRVVVSSIRGMDKSDARGGSKKNSWTSEPDVNEAFLSLHIGRPLLGQRTLDVLTLLESLRSNFPAQGFPGFDIVATGPSALAALHAAVLDEHGLIRGLTMDRSVVSWQGVVRTGVCKGQLAWAVPGVLAYYDLPELAARLAPLPVTVRNPVDPLGKPVQLAELRSAYAAALDAYGAGGKLVLEATP